MNSQQRLDQKRQQSIEKLQKMSSIANIQQLEKQNSTRLPTNLDVNVNSSLFSFDLNFDSLKQFLDKTTVTINQHAELINALQAELLLRPTHAVLPQQLGIIAEAGKIMNVKLENIVNAQTVDSLRSEETGDVLETATNKIFNKITSLGYATAYNFSQIGTFPEKFEIIEKELAKKSVNEVVKMKRKQLKKKVFEEFEEIKKQFDQKIIDLDSKYLEKVAEVQSQVDEVEKKTVWRIQDCEEMLKKRITQEYVDESCKLLEDRIKRESQTAVAAEADKNERIAAELLGRMKLLEDTQNEKYKNQKKIHKDFEEYTESSFAKQMAFEDFKKSVILVQDTLQRRQKDIDNSLNIQPVLDKQSNRIKALDDRIGDIADNVTQRLSDLVKEIAQIKLKEAEGAIAASGIDPHKLCQMEGDLFKAMEDVKKFQNELSETKKKVTEKLDNINLSVYEAGMNFGGDGGGVGGAASAGMADRIEDLANQINNIEIQMSQNVKQEELQKIQVSIKEITKQTEEARELEKKVQRFIKDMDINGMQRSIRQKAECDDVQKDFAIVDTKINTQSEKLNYCRKDIDNLIKLNKKLLLSLQAQNPQNTFNSILTTKKLTPINQLNCFSCGVEKSPEQTQQNTSQQRQCYSPDKTFFNLYTQPKQPIGQTGSTVNVASCIQMKEVKQCQPQKK